MDLGKFAVTMAGNATFAQGALGWFALFYSNNLGGYQDPDHIGGYTFNQSDGRWYETPPAPDLGQFAWENPASSDVQSSLTGIREANLLHNEIEHLNPGDGTNQPFPTELADALWQRVRDWIQTFGPILVDSVIDLNPELNDLYLRARNFVRRDPLAIDLDGDGIETVGVNAGVLFDHNADAIKTGTGWLKADDAFVVLDRDGNGTIDSGRELFGVDTIVGTEPITGRTLYAADGFAALKSLDANGDGLFNSADAQYANVRLWRDLNQDGISQTAELQDLATAGITALDLATRKATRTLPGGNTQTLTAAVAGLGESAAVATARAAAESEATHQLPGARALAIFFPAAMQKTW